jgi:hypothetical protein
MEIHDPNLHLKLIEMCDCYMDTDFHSQIHKTATASPEDLEEESIKYIALAIMNALTEKAQKLTFKRKKTNITVAIKADGDKIALSTPTPEMFAKIISIMRTILHMEEDTASLPMALGLRSGQVELQVKVERKGDKESLKIKLPDLGK